MKGRSVSLLPIAAFLISLAVFRLYRRLPGHPSVQCSDLCAACDSGRLNAALQMHGFVAISLHSASALISLLLQPEQAWLSLPTAHSGMEQPPSSMEQPPSPPSAAGGGSSQAVGDGGQPAASGAPATPASSAGAAAGTPPSADSSPSSSSSQQPKPVIAGAELYEQHLRRALAVPEAQRDADLRSFLAAHAALEAAAAALEAEEAAGGGQGGLAAPGSEERRLLGTARYLVARWATATAPGLNHPRLANALGPPQPINDLLWRTVGQPSISLNVFLWLPAPSCTLPNEDALRWSEPGAPRLDARRLLLLLLLADAMSVGVGAAGALRFLAAVQRTLRNPHAAQQVEAGLAAMAARAGDGAVAPSVHELSVAW